MTAAAKGDIDKVRACLDAETDVHFENDRALLACSITGSLSVMALLVDRGADIHANDDEVLYHASKRGDVHMTQYLIEKGADVDRMLRAHKGAMDQDCLNTLDVIKGNQLSEQFQQNFNAFQKRRDGMKKPRLD